MTRNSTVSPEEILKGFSPEIVALANQVRDLVLETVLDATEAGYAGWRAVAFRHPRAGYICGAFPSESEVRFLFEQGIHLPDPQGILEGATRQTRHVTLRPGAEIPAAALRSLILESVAYGESRALARKTKRRV